MENTKSFVRRTISISPYVSDAIDQLSKDEFGGNASAFIAHSVLNYVKCRHCNMHIEDTQKSANENQELVGLEQKNSRRIRTFVHDNMGRSLIK